MKIKFRKILVNKATISVFLVFNVYTVLQANRITPPIAESFLSKYTYLGHSIRIPMINLSIDRFIDRYANISGTNLKAMMYSKVSHSAWLLLISAQYADGTDYLLPLAIQSPRTFLQRTFVDNKGGKFLSLLSRFEAAQKLYANYLCKEFHLHNGAPIQSISFSSRQRNALDRKTAYKTGHHSDKRIRVKLLNRFSCSRNQRVNK